MANNFYRIEFITATKRAAIEIIGCVADHYSDIRLYLSDDGKWHITTLRFEHNPAEHGNDVLLYELFDDIDLSLYMTQGPVIPFYEVIIFEGSDNGIEHMVWVKNSHETFV